jgi:hypothetical protein
MRQRIADRFELHDIERDLPGRGSMGDVYGPASSYHPDARGRAQIDANTLVGWRRHNIASEPRYAQPGTFHGIEVWEVDDRSGTANKGESKLARRDV